MCWHLTINDTGDAITCHSTIFRVSKDCKSLDEISNFILDQCMASGVEPDAFPVMCSSSIDWPEDHPNVTQNVIEMCKEMWA